MPSNTDIANWALTRMGARADIGTLGVDTTPHAIKLSSQFLHAYNFILEQHDWAFARNREPMTKVTYTVDGFDFVYRVPSDCLIFRGIHNGVHWPSPPYVYFERSTLPIATVWTPVIMTNKDNAVGIFTRNNVELSSWTEGTIEALVLALASMTAADITGSAQIGMELAKRAEDQMQKAWAIERTQVMHEYRTVFVPPWLRMRR